MKLTIFTPTYNRALLLKRVFMSLLRQTRFDFEWLIIDDGSNDETELGVQCFIDNGRFPVRYYRKKNGGKHTAHNLAVELALGDYFMCLDSDDQLAAEAVNDLLSFLDGISGSDGVISYKADEKVCLLSDTFPECLEYTTTVELTLHYGCNGEFTLVYPTALLKKNPFPTFEGEKFITECVLYDRLSRLCRMRLFPKPICVCEYQEEGYSSNLDDIMKNNPAGYCLYFLQRIDLQLGIMNRIVCAGKYHCFKNFAKEKASEYYGAHMGLVAFCKPLGLLFRLYYKLFRGF